MQRVALIGAGGMGKHHASCYAEMPNAELVAVMDILPEAAELTAQKYGAKAYSDAHKMLEEMEIDVVDVCTPTPWHTHYVKMAAEAGKHVVTEKPFGRSLDQCREAIEACEKAGVTLFVAHVVRWFQEFARGKELIDSGAVGNPSIVRTVRGGRCPGGWFGDFEQSGGVILDLIIHDFDWLLHTFGPAERVFAKGLYNHNIHETDYALVTIRFRSGVIGHVEGSWAWKEGFNVSYEVAGDKGLIDFAASDSAALVVSKWGTEEGASGITIPSNPVAESPYYLELKHFIDCVESGEKPLVEPREAMAAVEVALAAIESVKTGQPVVLG